MDFDLKQWRDDHHSHSHSHSHSNSLSQPTATPPSSKLPSALPLFLSEPNRNLSAFSSDHSSRIPRMENYFSSSQWQELELQALIFRHMSAGADIPPELLHLVKKSLITSPFYHYYPHFQPSLVQTGYWGRGAMDPEPGRCRRTDGKKWRCSRDVVAAQKYCERHMHRGKNRSRKPVETPTSATSPYGGDSLKTTNSLTRLGAPSAAAAGGDSPHFTLSVPSHSTDLLHLNQRPLPDSVMRAKGPFEAHTDHGRPPSGRTTLRFFDDWPKSLHDSANNAPTNVASPTNLSISIPGNPTSDFSLKLGTGNGGEGSAQHGGGDHERDKPTHNWGMTWETNPAAPMGGPLAEVLRSSTSSHSSSPTSVLHRLQRAPTSEASY